MAAPVAHPAELARFDLFGVWDTADPLTDRFDPFSFPHRMAAYRALIDATNRGGRFGPDNRRNPLWGLMFQHQWQFRTGRLGIARRDDGRIDPDATWGYGNYALSVIPWLGATAAGIVPDLFIAGPPVESRFRYARGGGPEPLELPAEFAAGVADWRGYFELVTATDQPGTDDEPIRFALWKAHKTCLDVVAARIAHVEPAPYSGIELTFLRGWCRMVDYLWAAAWPTDFDFMVRSGLDVLPERLLTDGTADLPPKVRRNVHNVIALAHTSAWRHRVNLKLWQRVMRTRAARDEVLTMLDALFNPNPGNAADRRRMVGYLLRP